MTEDKCLGLRKSGTLEVIPLRLHGVLGRNPTKKVPGTVHVDLGLTRENAPYVSRKMCVVESLSEDEIRLAIPEEFRQKKARYPIKHYVASTETAITIHKEMSITLRDGDELIFTDKGREHKFEVRLPSQRVMRSRTRNDKSSTTEATPNKRPKLQDSTNYPSRTSNKSQQIEVKQDDDMKTRRSSRQENLRNELQPPRASSILKDGQEQYSMTWLEMSKLDERDNQSGSIPGTTNDLSEKKWWAPPRDESLRLQALAQKSTRKRHDEDSDEENEDGTSSQPLRHLFPQDMHVTLANTYWKALNSEAPHTGSTLLHMLLDDLKLPPPKLCRDLVHLVTFGCHTGRGLVYDPSATEGKVAPKPYFDGCRLDLALEYIDEVCLRYPAFAYDRFAEAVGPDYWRNALEHLYSLPYVKEEHNIEGNEHQLKRSVQLSLQLHTYNTRLLYRLVNGLIHRPCMKSPIIRDMDQFGGAGIAACKLASQVLSHLWVEFAHEIMEGSALAIYVEEILKTVGAIVHLMLQKFLPKKQSNRESVDILWNAMDGKIQASELFNDKSHLRQLKLMFVESIGDIEGSGALGDTIAKRLRMFKDYNTIASAK